MYSLNVKSKYIPNMQILWNTSKITHKIYAFIQVSVYIYYPPPHPSPRKNETNLKIALSDQEPCITPKPNTLAGNNRCRKGLKEKLLTGGRAPNGAVSFLHRNEAQSFKRTSFADFWNLLLLLFWKASLFRRTQSYCVKVRNRDYVPHFC